MDRFIGKTPKTEVEEGLLFIHCDGGKVVMPISVARKFVERVGRQLDQFDRQRGGNVAPLHIVKGAQR